MIRSRSASNTAAEIEHASHHAALERRASAPCAQQLEPHTHGHAGGGPNPDDEEMLLL